MKIGKYIGAVLKARSRVKSGMQNSDVAIMANEIYRADMKADFKMHFAYDLLHTIPKFLDMYMETQKQNIYNFDVAAESPGSDESLKRSRFNAKSEYVSSPNPDTPSSVDLNSPQYPARPSGVKAAKKKGKSPLPNMQFVDGMREEFQKGFDSIGALHSQKMEDWKHVKLTQLEYMREIEIEKLKVAKEMEENRIRHEKEKMDDTTHGKKIDLLMYLMGKGDLDEAELALKKKLVAEFS